MKAFILAVFLWILALGGYALAQTAHTGLPSGVTIHKLTYTVDADKTVDFGKSDTLVTMYGSGTFGSGTLTLKQSPDGTTFFDVSGATLTVDGFKTSTLGAHSVRVSLTGSTSPTITVWLIY